MIARYLLRLIFLTFGFNGFLHFILMPLPTGVAMIEIIRPRPARVGGSLTLLILCAALAIAQESRAIRGTVRDQMGTWFRERTSFCRA